VLGTFHLVGRDSLRRRLGSLLASNYALDEIRFLRDRYLRPNTNCYLCTDPRSSLPVGLYSLLFSLAPDSDGAIGSWKHTENEDESSESSLEKDFTLEDLKKLLEVYEEASLSGGDVAEPEGGAEETEEPEAAKA